MICHNIPSNHTYHHNNAFCSFSADHSIDTIRGFTRETLIGIMASIETREWRYHFNKSNLIAPERPRSSTTDDVECFFSVLRDCVGKSFTLKQVAVCINTLD